MTRSKGSPKWAQYKDKHRRDRKSVGYIPNADYLKLFPEQNNSASPDELIAPKEFSILTNRNKVIGYLKKVMAKIQDGRYTIMNMRDITVTDLATIAVVISMMMDGRPDEGKIRDYITVQIPRFDTEPGKLFREAQFHQTVTRQGIADHTFFLSRKSNDVNIEYIGDVLDYANKFLGEGSTEHLSPIMVEIMQNTNNHANPDADNEDENVPWFLAVHENSETGVMSFTVVDLGVGIFESLKLKNLADTSRLFDDAINDMYDNSQSKFLTTTIPLGVSSTTGLSYRGKGLKTVHALANRGNYGTFKIVTNRALVDLLNTNKSASIDSGESVDGTIYYWEMNKNG